MSSKDALYLGFDYGARRSTRIDRRFSAETRSIELDGRHLGGSWR